MPQNQTDPGAAAPHAVEPAPPAVPHASRWRWLRRFLLALGPLAVLAGGGYYYLTSGRYVSTQNAYIHADKVMVSAQVTGLITEVDVRDNQHVARGDVLFRIDDRPYRLALSQAEAQLASVRDDIESNKAAWRQKKGELGLARTNLAFAKTTYERQSRLKSTGTASAATLDAARHGYDVARQQIDVIRQEMAQLRAQLNGDPDIAVERHPRYLAALAARNRAALDLRHCVVRAPFAGVSGRAPQVGELVTGNDPLSQPVMSIVADTRVWVEANLKETELTHVAPGQPVTVNVDTYPARVWHGTVNSISQATGAEFSVIPAQNATGNWVKVVQRIPVRIAIARDRRSPVLRAGMSVSVAIDTGYHRPLPGFVKTVMAWFDDAVAARPARAEEAR